MEKPTKGKKDRAVPMSEKLLTFLKKHKLSSGSDKYVLPRISDWKKGKAAEILRQFQRELNIRETKFHSIRGSFITNLLARGESVTKVQQMVGHDDLETTLFYLGALGSELKGATDKIGFDFDEFDAPDKSKIQKITG